MTALIVLGGIVLLTLYLKGGKGGSLFLRVFTLGLSAGPSSLKRNVLATIGRESSRRTPQPQPGCVAGEPRCEENDREDSKHGET